MHTKKELLRKELADKNKEIAYLSYELQAYELKQENPELTIHEARDIVKLQNLMRV